MTGSRFYREHASLMREGTRDDHAQRVSEAYDLVRDKWISEGRHLELVRAIVANWTSGNCVDYMAPLSRQLVRSGETELHRHLWTRTIKRQVQTFFSAFMRIEGVKPAYLRLLNIDVRGFVETDPASYLNRERAAAFLLQRLASDLALWKEELVGAGLPSDEPDRIARTLQRLKAPAIKVNRLPPGDPSKPRPIRGPP